jgi:hypothetical protein
MLGQLVSRLAGIVADEGATEAVGGLVREGAVDQVSAEEEAAILLPDLVRRNPGGHTGAGVNLRVEAVLVEGLPITAAIAGEELLARPELATTGWDEYIDAGSTIDQQMWR